MDTCSNYTITTIPSLASDGKTWLRLEYNWPSTPRVNKNQLRRKTHATSLWKSNLTCESEGVMISQNENTWKWMEDPPYLSPATLVELLYYIYRERERENLPIKWRTPNVSLQNDQKTLKNTDFLTPSSKEDDGGVIPDPQTSKSCTGFPAFPTTASLQESNWSWNYNQMWTPNFLPRRRLHLSVTSNSVTWSSL